MQTRVCLHCEQEKPIDQYQLAVTQGREYRRSTCKSCMGRYYKLYKRQEHKTDQRRSLAYKIKKLEQLLEIERERVRKLTEELKQERDRTKYLYSWTG